MFNFIVAGRAGYCEKVELRVMGQILRPYICQSRMRQTSYLLVVDRLERIYTGIGARLDLGEHQALAAHCHNVYLVVTCPPVALADGIAFRSEDVCGYILSPFAGVVILDRKSVV